ncbi:hypothetical protein Y032_0193g1409 [Ancylostoma ceylanicum]|uniref:Uncharacterized protein n=1 Tax=Ancylostoma ceylanicum TaxID=53326 RepID=A0A016SPN9_9BILA|nr:hypothetical protein Y032_0193g1409 [Ancylostoma ceylanicum]
MRCYAAHSCQIAAAYGPQMADRGGAQYSGNSRDARSPMEEFCAKLVAVDLVVPLDSVVDFREDVVDMLVVVVQLSLLADAEFVVVPKIMAAT